MGTFRLTDSELLACRTGLAGPPTNRIAVYWHRINRRSPPQDLVQESPPKIGLPRMMETGLGPPMFIQIQELQRSRQYLRYQNLHRRSCREQYRDPHPET